MAYASVDNIQSEFKNIVFNATSSVNDTEVLEFIAQEEAVINLTISNRYETPVTGAVATEFLKRISIAFVAYRVAKILNLKKDVPIPEKLVAQDLSDGSFYFTAVQQLLKVRDGGIILSDAVARSLGQGVASFNSDNNVDPLWIREDRQW